MYTYKHPRPAVTVDIAIFRPFNHGFQILLIQRDRDPFQGMNALPGGFLDQNESLEEAAARELSEETGLIGVGLSQIHTFSALDRDPRGHTVSTCFGGLLDPDTGKQIRAGDDARTADWFALEELPPLAFDHELIIKTAVSKILNL